MRYLMGWNKAEILDGYITVGPTRKEVIKMTTSNLNNRSDKEIKEQGIPSSLKSEKYNKATDAAIEEGRKIAKVLNVKGYHTLEELKKALEL